MDSNGNLIKHWPNWSGEVPQKGDLVRLHFGDNNEEEESYAVFNRIIDGTKPDSVIVIISKLEDKP